MRRPFRFETVTAKDATENSAKHFFEAHGEPSEADGNNEAEHEADPEDACVAAHALARFAIVTTTGFAAFICLRTRAKVRDTSVSALL